MNKHSRFFSLLEKYELTPENLLLVFFCFWLTVLAVRGAIFWMVYHGVIPAIFVKGLHIHHFITGFLLLTLAIILFSKKIFSNYVPLAVAGSALALIFDEFLYWTRGHFNYWSLINLGATIIIGSSMMLAHLMAKHKTAGKLSKKRIIGTALLTIAFSSFLFMLFHYDRLLNGVYNQKDPAGQDYIDQDLDN